MAGQLAPEQLALEAAQGIERVKCIPRLNDKGNRESGWVTVVIVPQSGESQPVPSVQLKRDVKTYLAKRSANVTAFPNRLRVAEQELGVAVEVGEGARRVDSHHVVGR